MESNDKEKIVLLKTFDLAIDASLAKTKLDAHGIPCFLTNENMAGVYPIPVSHHFSVRLMIFDSDADKAIAILSDEKASTSICPFCKSKSISSEISRSWAARLATMLGGLSLGFLFPHKRIYRCADCKREFDYPENF